MSLPLTFDLEFKAQSVRGEAFLPHHVPGVLEMEQLCFPAPWSRDLIAGEAGLKTHTWNMVAHVGGELRAFFMCWTVEDEIHLLNFAVHPDLQGRGFGGRLLDWLCDTAREQGYGCVHLEVRASNAPAIRLYESRGFATLYRRRGYYTDNGEDAIVMVKPLRPARDGGDEDVRD